MEVMKMRQLEDENNRLKKVIADLTLDKAILQDVLSRELCSLFAAAVLSMRFAETGRFRSGGLARACG